MSQMSQFSHYPRLWVNGVVEPTWTHPKVVHESMYFRTYIICFDLLTDLLD